MAVKLSIITPVKNAGPWLGACLQSGLGQSFTDWEWLWIDDHSSDNSLALLRQYSKADARLHICSNPADGILPALQYALKLAQGEFVTRMDADDIMPPGRLAAMVKCLENSPRRSVITGQLQYFSEKPLSPGYRKYQDWLNTSLAAGEHWQNIYRECVVASPNWMMRRAELEDIGGFDNLQYPEDYDLVFRWYRHGFRINMLQQLTLLWREHLLRTSRTSENYHQRAFFRLKMQRFIELDYRGGPLCLWGTGTKAQLCKRELKQHAIPFIQMALKAEPRKQISSYRETQKLHSPQVLLAVYPPAPQRLKLTQYLQSIALHAAKDYWFV